MRERVCVGDAVVLDALKLSLYARIRLYIRVLVLDVSGLVNGRYYFKSQR